MITQPPKFDPYPNCEGRWVATQAFLGRQSFGYFKCFECKSGWMSSRAQKTFKQGCKKCLKDCMPLYMWQNTFKSERKNKKTLQDNKKQHMKQLCQACKKGRCFQGFYRTRDSLSDSDKEYSEVQEYDGFDEEESGVYASYEQADQEDSYLNSQSYQQREGSHSYHNYDENQYSQSYHNQEDRSEFYESQNYSEQRW